MPKGKKKSLICKHGYMEKDGDIKCRLQSMIDEWVCCTHEEETCVDYERSSK
jgi:hypothetical protein